MDIKQVIVVRADLKMRRGKENAQCSHASMKVFFDKSIIFADGGSYLMEIPLTYEMAMWASGNFKKVSLSCGSEEELIALFKKAKDLNLPCAMVVDSGLTEFHNVPTKTCIAIGPAKAEEIDKVTGHLTLR